MDKSLQSLYNTATAEGESPAKVLKTAETFLPGLEETVDFSKFKKTSSKLHKRPMRASEVDDFGSSMKDVVSKRRKLYGFQDLVDDVSAPFTAAQPALERIKESATNNPLTRTAKKISKGLSDTFNPSDQQPLIAISGTDTTDEQEEKTEEEPEEQVARPLKRGIAERSNEGLKNTAEEIKPIIRELEPSSTKKIVTDDKDGDQEDIRDRMGQIIAENAYKYQYYDPNDPYSKNPAEALTEAVLSEIGIKPPDVPAMMSIATLIGLQGLAPRGHDNKAAILNLMALLYKQLGGYDGIMNYMNTKGLPALKKYAATLKDSITGAGDQPVPQNIRESEKPFATGGTPTMPTPFVSPPTRTPVWQSTKNFINDLNPYDSPVFKKAQYYFGDFGDTGSTTRRSPVQEIYGGFLPPRQGIARPIPYVPPNDKRIDYSRFIQGAATNGTPPLSSPLMTGFFRGMDAFQGAVSGGMTNTDAALFGASAFYDYYQNEGKDNTFNDNFRTRNPRKRERPPPIIIGQTSLQDDAGGMTRVSSSVESILAGGGQQPQQPNDNRALARQDFETYQRHSSVPYAV